MSKLTSFNSANLDNVRAAINAALSNVEKEFGITLKVGPIKFTPESFNTTLGAMCGADDPMMAGVNPKDVQECLKYTETKDLFKKSCVINGISITVVGIKPRTRGDKAIVRLSTDNSLRVVDTKAVRASLNKKVI